MAEALAEIAALRGEIAALRHELAVHVKPVEAALLTIALAREEKEGGG